MTSLPPGRVDIHSHLIPSIDDGCRIIDESIDCVLRLKARGYVGTICTPHVIASLFPNNTAENIRTWVQQLDRDLQAQGILYRVWPGGEHRLEPGLSERIKDNDPPTLADTKIMLFDFWADKWPKWVNAEFEAIIKLGYQPVLAHPERLNIGAALDKHLAELTKIGVWLQGNFRSVTGEEGFKAADMVRLLLSQNRYTFLALDMHGPETLDSRLDGVALAESEFGADVVEKLVAEAPRHLILGESSG